MSARPRLFAGDERRRMLRGSELVAYRGDETASPQLYPMYVMSFAEVLALERLRPHQHLLAEGKLVEIEAQHAGCVVFVSQ